MLSCHDNSTFDFGILIAKFLKIVLTVSTSFRTAVSKLRVAVVFGSLVLRRCMFVLRACFEIMLSGLAL